MMFQLENEGWGPMEHANLALNMFPTEHGEDFDTPFRHHLELGTIDESCEIQLADTFASLGVEVERPKDENRASFVKDGGLGLFANGYAILCGVLSYQYRDVAGKEHDAVVKIGTCVCLMPPRLGMYAPPSYQYNAAFEVDGADYEVRVPLSQSLRSGEMDRFNVRIAAEKSSIHRFRVRLVCNGEALPESLPMALSLFVPRSQANKARLEDEKGG